jgi:hypothetical protein
VVAPYTEHISTTKITRTFNTDIDVTELVWHRDKNDRTVTVINESDWLFQIDNELPIKLTQNTKIHIPKENYHRVIKGTTNLIVNIKE